MLHLTVNNWKQAWVAINRAFDEDPHYVVDQKNSTYGFSIDNSIVIRENSLDGLSESLVHYSEVKLKAFETYYVLPNELERIIDLIYSRHLENSKKYTVASYNFRQDNSKHSMGSCVINIIIHVEDRGDYFYVYFEPNMRTAEVLKRLVVDFMFFQHVIEQVIDLLQTKKKVRYDILFRSRVLFLHIIQAILGPTVIPGITYSSDHWLHLKIHDHLEKVAQPDFKMKSAKRVYRHLQELKERENAKEGN